MWYILFVVYAPYAMLPLPLRWCVLAGYGTALTHMVMAGITLLRDPTYVRILGLHFGLYYLFFFTKLTLLVHPYHDTTLSSLATSQVCFATRSFLFVKVRLILQLQLHDVTCIVRMLTTNVLLYLAMNLAGMYTKYLTDRGQRQAFLETHRSMETRQRTQNENNRQEKLLLSGETCFILLVSI